MADKKITELPAATLPIATGVKFEAVQGGINVQVDADDMPGSGAAGVTSVTGTTNRITSTGGATPVIDIAAAYDAAVTAEIAAAAQTKIDALLTIKTKTAAHTLDADDLADVNLGKALNFIMDVAAGHDFTIPPNATQAFPIGTQLLVDYINTGATAFVAGSGVTIQSADGLTIAARYKGVVLKKIDTNTWLLQGALTT